jgi:Tol biopolymer transport system component
MPAGVTARPNLGLAGVSPDARLVAVIAEQAGEAPAIWILDLADGVARPLPDSAGAVQPFWSPDSRSLGFFQDGRLRVIPVSGGPPHDLCAALAPRGGTWNKDGTIVFGAGTRSPLFAIPASGGTPSKITSLDPVHRDVSHRYPHFLPDGRHFVFLVWAGDVERGGIYLGSLDGGPPVRLLPDLSPAIWSAGHLFFVRRETLVAQPMAATRLTGEARVVATPVGRDPNDSVALAASSSGDLVFQRGQELTQLVWFDRTGQRLGDFGPPAHWADPAISPRGDRVAFVHRDRAAGKENLDVWTETLADHKRMQETFDPAIDVLPVFSDDGRELIFRSNRSGFSDLYRKRLDAAVHESPLLASKTRKDPTDWSRDGWILVTETPPGGHQEIWLYDVDGLRPSHAVVKEPAPALNGRFSPDGQYIAFELRSGRSEVYVQALADGGHRWRVSADGGGEPAWRADGRELFFVSGDHITAVDVSPAADGLTFGAPHPLFETAMFVGLRNGMAVSPDGQRFLISVPVPDAHPTEVVLHWQGRAVGREQR